MEIFKYIINQIIIGFVGDNVYYLIRKIMGDKRNYKQIKEQTEGFIRFWTGSFAVIIIVIFLVKCTS